MVRSLPPSVNPDQVPGSIPGAAWSTVEYLGDLLSRLSSPSFPSFRGHMQKALYKCTTLPLPLKSNPQTSKQFIVTNLSKMVGCVSVCVERGGWSFGLYHDFPNRLHIKDEALESKQLLVNLLLFISESSFN